MLHLYVFPQPLLVGFMLETLRELSTICRLCTKLKVKFPHHGWMACDDTLQLHASTHVTSCVAVRNLIRSCDI